MCMINVNAFMELYDGVTGDLGNRNFIKLFDSIELSRDENGNCCIKDIYLVININIMKSFNENNIKYNVLNNHGKLHVQLQLVKNGDDNISISLSEFKYDFSELGENHTDIVQYDKGEYFSQKRILKIDSIVLPNNWENGNYRFELLLKRENPDYIDKEWILQTFCSLEIKTLLECEDPITEFIE